MPELAAVFCDVGEPTYDDENFVVAARHCFEEMGLDGEVAACGGGLQSEAAWGRSSPTCSGANSSYRTTRLSARAAQP